MSIATDYSADERLAVYGSLRPGEKNAHILAPLAGQWIGGTVRGRLRNAGWAAAGGYPAIVLDKAGESIEVALLCSHELPAMWAKLDAFEGADYRRMPVDVRTEQGPVAAFIYALTEPVRPR